nr:RHS repeat-associated core domain-containing protein [Dyella sp. SG562]
MTTDTSGCAAAGGACHRAGDLYQVTDALGHVATTSAYDLAGRPTRQVDANGVITDLTYTPRGWLKTRTVAGATTTYTYKPYGAVESVTDADGVTVTYTYDSAHRLTDVTDAQGNHVHYTLDAAGNRTDEATYAVGSSTPSRHVSRTFNNLGQLTKIIDGLNNTIFDASASGAYDSNGNLVTSVDALGVTQTRSYDGLNRYSGLQSSATVNGSTVVSSTSYTYDVLDNLTQTLTPDYKYTTSAYDGLSNRKTLTSPDTGTTSSTFDVAGNVLTRTDAKNIVATSSYDALNRVLTTTYVDTSLNVAYHYDEADSVTGCVGSYPVGRLTRMVEASVTTVYCYDARGNITQKSQSQGSATDVTGYSYTSADRLASVATPSGTSVQYQHDTVGRISSITALPPGTTGAGTGNIATSITYLPFGPVASYTLGNGQTVTRTYDLNYQVTDATSPALNLHFARDAMGRITALGNAPGANPATETYGYDWLSRLTGVNNAAGTSVESYTYDAIGNRTGKTGSGLATGTYSYYQYPHNWLSYIGSAARAYDNNGNTTASSVGGESFGFGYNGRNRMTIAQRNGSTVGTYTYNVLGERIAKVATLPASLSQRFAYDENSQLIGEYGGTTRDYIWLEDLPLAVIDTQAAVSTTDYVHADGLNTPRAVTDNTGVTVWQWPYQSNPFGETQPSSTGGYTLNLRFAGQYYDTESRIAYNVNRHYEAATGRYLQSDPAGLTAGPSTYGYAYLSPLTFTDQLGLLPKPLPPERQRLRNCKTPELEQCEAQCAANGTTVQSCKVNQIWTTRIIKGPLSGQGWHDSEMSCSCNEPPEPSPFAIPDEAPSRSRSASPACNCTDPIECATH